MSFSLTSISPATFREGGGHEIQITGVFEMGHRYRVHIGELGTTSDLSCYSGKMGQEDTIYPWTSSILRAYSPVLTPNRTVSVTVLDLDTTEQHTLTDVGATVFRYHKSQVFSLRKMFPIFYKTGARDIGEVE